MLTVSLIFSWPVRYVGIDRVTLITFFANLMSLNLLVVDGRSKFQSRKLGVCRNSTFKRKSKYCQHILFRIGKSICITLGP